MASILHIITQTPDELAQNLAAVQRENADNRVEVVDLTQADPDYAGLVDKIFAANSIEVW